MSLVQNAEQLKMFEAHNVPTRMHASLNVKDWKEIWWKTTKWSYPGRLYLDPKLNAKFKYKPLLRQGGL